MNLDAEPARLETLDLRGLRAEWEQRYGETLTFKSIDLLRRVLAWRIQAAVLGDLDPATRRMLRHDRPVTRSGPPPGTILVREWQGERHEVEVTDDGFVHDGRVWKSLSQVAAPSGIAADPCRKHSWHSSCTGCLTSATGHHDRPARRLLGFR